MIFILINYIRDMSRNTKRWELLNKHVKKCIIMLKEIITIKDQSKGQYVFILNILNYNVCNILIILSIFRETTYDKHLDNVHCVLGRLCEIENLTMVILKSCQYVKNSIPNNTKKLNKNSHSEVQKIKMIPSKVSFLSFLFIFFLFIKYYMVDIFSKVYFFIFQMSSQEIKSLSSPPLNLGTMAASTSLCSVISSMIHFLIDFCFIETIYVA